MGNARGHSAKNNLLHQKTGARFCHISPIREKGVAETKKKNIKLFQNKRLQTIQCLIRQSKNSKRGWSSDLEAQTRANDSGIPGKTKLGFKLPDAPNS